MGRARNQLVARLTPETPAETTVCADAYFSSLDMYGNLPYKRA